MNILNKIFYLLFLGLFVFIVALIAFLISSNVITDLNKNIIVSGIIAFFGAFFAFIFIKISEWFSLIRKGNVNHFNSIVKIERLLNKVISCLEENILTFQDNLEALRSMKLLTWSYNAIPFSNELADDLKNIDFVNEYFSFSLDMETLDNDFITMKSMYEEVKGLYLSKTVSPETYKDNVSFCIDKMNLIIKYMKSFQEKAVLLLTKARLLQNEKKNWNFLFGAFPKRHYKKGFDKKVKEEIKVLRKEIDEVRKKSKEEKEKIRSS